MPATLQEVSDYLSEANVRFREHDEHTLVLMYEMEQYRNIDGEGALLVAIALEEEGQYVKIFAPSAFNASESEHLDTFLRACMMVQWKTKLVQFEYDPTDGEVRPIVEFALEDAPLTQKQLMRCVSGLVGLLDHFAPTLYRALDEGVIEMPDEEVEEEATIESLAEFLAGFPADILAEALTRADARMRNRQDGDAAAGYHPENDPDADGPEDFEGFNDTGETPRIDPEELQKYIDAQKAARESKDASAPGDDALGESGHATDEPGDANDASAPRDATGDAADEPGDAPGETPSAPSGSAPLPSGDDQPPTLRPLSPPAEKADAPSAPSTPGDAPREPEAHGVADAPPPVAAPDRPGTHAGDTSHTDDTAAPSDPPSDGPAPTSRDASELSTGPADAAPAPDAASDASGAAPDALLSGFAAPDEPAVDASSPPASRDDARPQDTPHGAESDERLRRWTERGATDGRGQGSDSTPTQRSGEGADGATPQGEEPSSTGPDGHPPSSPTSTAAAWIDDTPDGHGGTDDRDTPHGGAAPSPEDTPPPLRPLA